MTHFQPAIKWSGSKRSQANEIIKFFPKKIDAYYEPFCGGASMLRAILESNIECNQYIVSDLNKDLIDLWKAIKDTPELLSRHYRGMWNTLNADNDLERKKRYFADIRRLFNEEHNPFQFLFIMRTTTNGMPRYNDRGEFNNSFHITRNGIHPDRLEKILKEWSELLNNHYVEFVCHDYQEINPTSRDFVYLDPPYAGTKGMYFGGIPLQPLWDKLRSLPCPWALSFDGRSGKEDNTYDVPKIYDEHHYIKSGNSSFRRIIGKSNDSFVFESLYIKGCKNIG